MITQMQVKGLMFDPYNNAYIVVLRDEEHSDMLPIWIGNGSSRKKRATTSVPLAQAGVTINFVSGFAWR